MKLIKLALQAVAYAGFAAFIGAFAASPVYQYADPSQSTVKLSVTYATDRREPCIRLSPEEIAKLAANMRRTEICERERVDMRIQLDIDGERIVDRTVRPSGIWKDGPASHYERFAIPAGEHHIHLKMRTSPMHFGWDYDSSQKVTVSPGAYLTITFDSARDRIAFR